MADSWTVGPNWTESPPSNRPTAPDLMAQTVGRVGPHPLGRSNGPTGTRTIGGTALGVAAAFADERLTLKQYGFLRCFLDGPPDRRLWLRNEGGSTRVIGEVAEPFEYHPAAERVKVYRLSDGQAELKGYAVGRTVLSVSALRELDGLWEIPLARLNAHGRKLAEGPPPEPLVSNSYRVAPELDRAIRSRATALGLTVTAYLLGLASADLASAGSSHAAGERAAIERRKAQ